LTGVSRGRCRRDAGAAVVDFVLVGSLVTLVFLGVVQLATVLHVRNTLIDCASEGARYGALAGSTPDAGAERARELIEADLSAAYAADVVSRRAQVGGLETVEVRVRAPLPVVGLVGVGRVVAVTGHAVAEPDSRAATG
jgi:Flp pilus assembly protein TadG